MDWIEGLKIVGVVAFFGVYFVAEAVTFHKTLQLLVDEGEEE